MLAKRRSLKQNGREIDRTPLLIPSFSSKGFPDIDKIIKYSSELIEGVTLISAYDLHYGKIKPPFDFPSLIFLDSGGYEASKDAELSDFGERERVPKPWSQDMHEAQLADWQPSVPSVLISYDHPKERLPIKAQIERARSYGAGPRGFPARDPAEAGNRHPEAFADGRHHQERACASRLRRDRRDGEEVGNSILNRMKNIAQFRRALDKARLETPIHVFGSLDTVTTPMYFLAGADIFDGLTWLRFAFHAGNTVYRHNYGALKFGVATNADVIDGRCWNDNYYYMKDMELEMRRYLTGGDFSVFRYHGDLFRSALQSAIEAIGA